MLETIDTLAAENNLWWRIVLLGICLWIFIYFCFQLYQLKMIRKEIYGVARNRLFLMTIGIMIISFTVGIIIMTSLAL